MNCKGAEGRVELTSAVLLPGCLEWHVLLGLMLVDHPEPCAGADSLEQPHAP